MSIQSFTKNISPETEMLLSCARTHVDIVTVERFKVLLKQHIDWGALLRLAYRHKVMPLLFQSLSNMDGVILPESILHQLRTDFRNRALPNTTLTIELLSLLKVLDSYEIRAIPYKGPILAEAIYGNLSLRQFDDLDIIVHEKDFSKTKKILSSHGWRQCSDLGWESAFLHQTAPFTLDLHQGITPKQFPLRFDFESWWNSRQEVILVNTKVSSFSPQDMLLVLCVQVAKDWWENSIHLAKVCDIAELLRAHPAMDWEQVIEQSKALGCQRMLFMGISLANNLLQAPLPDDIAQRALAQRSVRSLTENVRERLLVGTEKQQQHKFMKQAQLHFKCRERWRDGLFPYFSRYLEPIFVPHEADRNIIKLPVFLSFIYYLVRPVRLVGKFLTGKYGWNPFSRLFDW